MRFYHEGLHSCAVFPIYFNALFKSEVKFELLKKTLCHLQIFQVEVLMKRTSCDEFVRVGERV